jgi:hypothetical protein
MRIPFDAEARDQADRDARFDKAKGWLLYSYRGNLTASNAPITTSGQTTRVPVPANPLAPPVPPEQRP